MAGLLDGVTVLDLASVGPAVRASGWLADYGAAVIRIAPVPRDAERQLTPKAHFYSGGRGTRRVMLDLKSPAGLATFLRMTKAADVVIESFRPGVVERLGIDYDAVKRVNPRVVYCSTSGYGQDGERAAWAGHDVNYLAVGGYLAGQETGSDGRPPLPGATIGDSAGGGMQAVTAILAGLVSRGTTNKGCYLDVAVAEGVLALMSLQVDDVLATGAEQPPGTAPLSGRYACYDTYRTSDDRWIAVGAVEGKFWANLCRLVGLDHWAAHQYDEAVQDEARTELAATFLTRTRDDWVAELAPADTCVSPVLTAAEIATDKGFASRSAFTTAHAVTGDTWSQLAPMLAGAVRESDYDMPDRSVSDTDDVLLECGFTPDDIAQLRDEGAIA